MVGVPGRSKACQTCKRRHIACDLLHLSQKKCGPCEKSKRVCVVPQGHIFVNHDAGTHKTVYRKVDGERDRIRSSQPTCSSVTERSDYGQPDFEHDIQHTPDISSQALPQSIGSTALVKQQFLANAGVAVRAGHRDDSDFPHFWSAAITSQSLDSWACKMSPALACYTSWLGRQNEDACLVDASRKLYIQGLKEVQQSVNDPSTALSDETLSACIGLIIYEAMECPDGSYSAYHQHIDGCSALIRLRGVDAHKEGVGHDLFRGFRYIAVIKALQDHRPTYLVSPDWSEIPFSIHPKDIHDKLLDILAIGANHLGKSDRLATTPPNEILAALLDIDDHCLALEHRMEVVFAELQSKHSGPLFWVKTPALELLDENTACHLEDSYNMPIEFPNADTARLLTLYWAQQCLLRMGRAELRTALAGMAAAGMVQGQAERVNRSLAQPVKPLLESAHLVLRSREYCCGSQSTLLRYSVPLNITLDVLANKPELYPAEIRIAKEVKKHISQRYLRITQFTRSLMHVKEV